MLARSSIEQKASFVRIKPAEKDQAKEFVERVAVAAYGIEDGVGRPKQQKLRMLYQRCSERMDLAFVANLCQYLVQVLNEEQQTFAALLVEVQKRCQRIGGLAIRVWFAGDQRVGLLCPLAVAGGVGQMSQCGEPQVGEIANAIALLVKGHRLPERGESGVLLNSAQTHQAHRGLAHAARADQQSVLARAICCLTANGAKKVRKGFLSCNEGLLQLVAPQLRGVVNARAAHDASPAWCFCHHRRSRLERKETPSPSRRM